MSTILHAVLKLVFGNVNFVIVFAKFGIEKWDFLQVVKIPYPKNRFLVILRSFFSMYKNFPGWGWIFPVSTLKGKYFDETMSSLAGLKKRFSIFRKITDFRAIFDYPGQPSKSIFAT